jgi:hypothetical protein
MFYFYPKGPMTQHLLGYTVKCSWWKNEVHDILVPRLISGMDAMVFHYH